MFVPVISHKKTIKNEKVLRMKNVKFTSSHNGKERIVQVPKGTYSVLSLIVKKEKASKLKIFANRMAWKRWKRQNPGYQIKRIDYSGMVTETETKGKLKLIS